MKRPYPVDADQEWIERRAFLRKSSALVVFFSTVRVSAWSKVAAAAKADRFDLNYQTQPRNGKSCANCWAYIPGTSQAVGTCKAIEGPISANGWCMAFSPKQGRVK